MTLFENFFTGVMFFERGVSLSCRCLDGGRSTGLEHIWKIHNSPTVQWGLLRGRDFLKNYLLVFCNKLKNKEEFGLTRNCVCDAMLQYKVVI